MPSNGSFKINSSIISLFVISILKISFSLLSIQYFKILHKESGEDNKAEQF